MSVLTKSEIETRLRAEWPLSLIITPLLDEAQIGDHSVDLRLGREFVVTRRANIPYVDPVKREDAEVVRRRCEDRISLGRGKPFYLHPGEFVLGSTLEYMRLPDDLGAYVTSRSSWGRVGLVIATAVAVAPGFRGVITFELTNLGHVPMALHYGVRIAQIVFHRAEAGQTYGGRYACPVGPEHGKIYLDPDTAFWCSL